MSFWRENAIAVVILLLVFNSENAIVVETSYQMSKVLSFSVIKITVLTFYGQKSKKKLSGVTSIFGEYAKKKYRSNLVRLES